MGAPKQAAQAVVDARQALVTMQEATLAAREARTDAFEAAHLLLDAVWELGGEELHAELFKATMMEDVEMLVLPL